MTSASAEYTQRAVSGLSLGWQSWWCYGSSVWERIFLAARRRPGQLTEPEAKSQKAEGPREGQELNIHKKKGDREMELGGFRERKSGRMKERKSGVFFFFFRTNRN